MGDLHRGEDPTSGGPLVWGQDLIFRTVQDIDRKLDDVQQRVVIMERIGETLTPLVGTRIDDHESRIRKLEAWRYGIPASVIVALGSLAVALIEVYGR